MSNSRRVLAVCSGGGHWIQMKRLSPAFKNCQLTYATVAPEEIREGNATVMRIPDANRDTKLRLCRLLIRLVWIFIQKRPEVVISTGAAPGYLAVRLGKLIGARTLFLDSVANADELSMSARLAVPFADVTLSQWENVAADTGVAYWGAVI